MAKKKTAVITKDSDKELVDYIIGQIPNLFDDVPRKAISRTAVEKFVKELKERI